MSDPIVVHCRVLTIEGGRKLYLYTFEERPADEEEPSDGEEDR